MGRISLSVSFKTCFLGSASLSLPSTTCCLSHMGVYLFAKQHVSSHVFYLYVIFFHVLEQIPSFGALTSSVTIYCFPNCYDLETVCPLLLINCEVAALVGNVSSDYYTAAVVRIEEQATVCAPFRL